MLLRIRFIPTCVGNISPLHGPAQSATVHPHVCGEHAREGAGVEGAGRFIPTCVGNIDLAEDVDGGEAGSSPRVWGTSGRPPRRPQPPRFIPTCVGNMLCNVYSRRLNAVHPHVCGEHVQAPSLLRFEPRFIPTCVGNMPSCHTSPLSATGSSPRVWGTFPPWRMRLAPLRFIPTCVGNIIDADMT